MSTGSLLFISHNKGGEFKLEAMRTHQDQKGTKQEYTAHDSPSQNGVAERGMITRAKHTWTLLLSSGLPCFLWEEAMNHSTWLQN